MRSTILLAGGASLLIWCNLVSAHAARIRPFVTVHGPVVHLSDLFSGLEPGQDCILGAGPDAGGQVVIEKPQLQAIADEFDVAWSGGLDWKSVTLSRSGQALDLASIVGALRRALSPLGVPKRSDIRIIGWRPVTVDPGTEISISAPSFDQSSGRFSADLLLSFAGRSVGANHLDGVAVALVRLAVPKHPILAGEIVSASDLTMVERPVGQLTEDMVTDPSMPVGLVASRLLATDQPIRRDSLRVPPLVTRGAAVMLRLSARGIDLAAGGEAIDTGAQGDRIRVLNPLSRALLVGTVIGPDEVEIDAGSMPIVTRSYPGISQPAGLRAPFGPDATSVMAQAPDSGVLP